MVSVEQVVQVLLTNHRVWHLVKPKRTRNYFWHSIEDRSNNNITDRESIRAALTVHLTIISRALSWYKMIDSQRGGQRRVVCNISKPTSTNGIIVLFKKNEERFLYLADFALQEQPEDNSMVAISRAWYNGSYTMAAKTIEALELRYTVIQLFKKNKCT